jgi:hypothetical protein
MAGRLLEYVEARPYPRPTAVPELSNELAVERLEVLSIDGDEAVVDLRATAQNHGRHRLWGVKSFPLNFDGPVVLNRIGGSWRIVDYVLDGKRLSDSLVLPRVANELMGVRVELIALDLMTSVAIATFAVENRRPESVSLDWACVATKKGFGGRWICNPFESVGDVAAGERAVDGVSWNIGFKPRTRKVYLRVGLTPESETGGRVSPIQSLLIVDLRAEREKLENR